MSPGNSSIAPTIPTAPHSPRDLDSFDFDRPFHEQFPAAAFSQSSMRPTTPSYGQATHGADAVYPSLSSSLHSNPPHHLPRSARPSPHRARPDLMTSSASADLTHTRGYRQPISASLDQGISSLGYDDDVMAFGTLDGSTFDHMTRSMPPASGAASSRVTSSRPPATSSHGAGRRSQSTDVLSEQLNYVSKQSQPPRDVTRPQTTPPDVETQRIVPSSRDAHWSTEQLNKQFNALMSLSREDIGDVSSPRSKMTSSVRQPMRSASAGASGASGEEKYPL